MRALFLLILIFLPFSLAFVSASPIQENRIGCDTCLGAFTFLETLFHKNKSVDEIYRFCKMICVPITGYSQIICDKWVDSFAPYVIEVLGSGIDKNARLFCAGMGFCPPVSPPHLLDFPKPKPNRGPPPVPNPSNPKKYLLHLTDAHIDFFYRPLTSPTCDDDIVCCHDASGDAGEWGDVSCDLSDKTFEATLKQIEEMASGGSEPWTHFDYIFYGGDNLAHQVIHTPSQLEYMTHFIRDAIATTFPEIPILFALGNHDVLPVNILHPKNIANEEWEKQLLYEVWGQHLSLTPKTIDTLNKTGSYSLKLPWGKSFVKVISPNFIYGEYLDFISYKNLSIFDNGNILRWLINELQMAEDDFHRVWLLGHIPPTIFNLRNEFTINLNRIINRYENTIMMQLYGHTHSDQFIVFKNETENRLTNVAFVTPSLTTFTNRNPAFHVVELDAPTGEPTNIFSYYSDLEEDNASGTLKFKQNYNLKEEYNLDSLRGGDFQELINDFSKNTTSPLFSKYLQHYQAEYPYECDYLCEREIKCYLIGYDYDQLLKCMSEYV